MVLRRLGTVQALGRKFGPRETRRTTLRLNCLIQFVVELRRIASPCDMSGSFSIRFDDRGVTVGNSFEECLRFVSSLLNICNLRNQVRAMSWTFHAFVYTLVSAFREGLH